MMRTRIERNVRYTLILMLLMFAWNVGLSLFIIAQFRKLPGLDAGKQVEASSKMIEQLLRNQASRVMIQNLELSIRQRMQADIAKILKLLETPQPPGEV